MVQLQVFHTPDKTNSQEKTRATTPGEVQTGASRLQCVPSESGSVGQTLFTNIAHVTIQEEDMSAVEKLQAELEALRAENANLQQEAEAAELKHKIEMEKRTKLETQAKIDKVRLDKAAAAHQHTKNMETIMQMSSELAGAADQCAWLQERLRQLDQKSDEEIELERRVKEKVEKLKGLLQQKENLILQARELVDAWEVTPEIERLINALVGTAGVESDKESSTITARMVQDNLIQQLRTALTKEETGNAQQRESVKQFLTQSSKQPGTGGTNTLKPELLKRLLGEGDSFSMEDWLAKYNIQEIDESQCSFSDEVECKHTRSSTKSGMLDKATANIQQKVIWAQKNLLEDWADEEIEFKQMQFEHLVAGELHTIKTCTEPTQILGRLRLLRRFEYAKLRGYKWHLVRKFYTAVMRSIKTSENTWSSNFDRFEAILYRRPQILPRANRGDKEDRQSVKKWFCRDWNKEGCNKSSPHKAWVITASGAVQKMVLHTCSACYMKANLIKDHPEGHDSCPYKEA